MLFMTPSNFNKFSKNLPWGRRESQAEVDSLPEPSRPHRRRSSINRAEVSMTKMTVSSSVSSRRPSAGRELGLMEAKKLADRCRQFGAIVMVARALATMKLQRRKRLVKWRQ